MIAVELTSNSRSAAAIGPCGSNTPALLHAASGNTAVKAAARNMALHRIGDGIGHEPIVMLQHPRGAVGQPTRSWRRFAKDGSWNSAHCSVYESRITSKCSADN